MMRPTKNARITASGTYASRLNSVAWRAERRATTLRATTANIATRMIQLHTRGLWMLSAGWNHQYETSAAMPSTISATMSAVRLQWASFSMNGGTERPS